MRRSGSPGTRRPGSGHRSSAYRRHGGARGVSWLPIVVARRGSSTVCFGLAFALVLPGIFLERRHTGFVVPRGLPLDWAHVGVPRRSHRWDRLDVAGSPAHRTGTCLHDSPPGAYFLQESHDLVRLARSMTPGSTGPSREEIVR